MGIHKIFVLGECWSQDQNPSLGHSKACPFASALDCFIIMVKYFLKTSYQLISTISVPSVLYNLYSFDNSSQMLAQQFFSEKTEAERLK